MNLTFLGAAGTVTGSKTLVTHEGHRWLVDCGLFQGYKNLRVMNWEPFPFDPKQLDGVVLTHAHLDHSGTLPLLVKQGLRGRVFDTPSTIDVCRILLPDSGRLQEEDAEFANRHRLSRHQPALPLIEDDAERALRRLEALPFDEPAALPGGAGIRLRPAGHIDVIKASSRAPRVPPAWKPANTMALRRSDPRAFRWCSTARWRST